MIKIKVSYESPEELMRLLAVLGDRVESWKVSRTESVADRGNTGGRFHVGARFFCALWSGSGAQVHCESCQSTGESPEKRNAHAVKYCRKMQNVAKRCNEIQRRSLEMLR